MEKEMEMEQKDDQSQSAKHQDRHHHREQHRQRHRLSFKTSSPSHTSSSKARSRDGRERDRHQHQKVADPVEEEGNEEGVRERNRSEKRRRRDGAEDDRDTDSAHHQDWKDARRERKKQERRERSHKRHHRDTHSREDQRTPPSHHPSSAPLFGDDLFAAERYEAAQKEKEEWEAKLHDLASENPFQSSYGEEAHYEVNRAALDATSPSSHLPAEAQRIPRRYMDSLGNTGLAFLSRGGLDMTDEEHSEYMREGMWRRRHADQLRAQEEEMRAKRKEKVEREEKEQRRKERARRKEKEREERVEREEREGLNEARMKWEERWSALKEQGSNGGPLYFSDLPWPCLSMWPASPDTPKIPQLDKSALSHFLLAPSPSSSSQHPPADAARNTLRQALLRYHPDRFFSAPWFQRVPETNGLRDKIKECVLQVARILNELQADARDAK